MKFLAFSLFLLIAPFGMSQNNFSIEELTRNSMSNKSGETGLNLSLWLSDYIWEYSARNTPGASEAMVEDIVRIMKGYNIFGVVVGKMDGNEIIRYADEEAIRSTVVLIGQDSVEYDPLTEDEISEELDFVLRAMKPMYAQMMGQFGENMHLIVFQKRNSAGELIADPLVEKNITLHTSGIDFEWRLPMSALVPKKKCPEDGELVNGTWKFCPYHGNELEVQ